MVRKLSIIRTNFDGLGLGMGLAKYAFFGLNLENKFKNKDLG